MRYASGASSSGSGVATAAGLCYASLGSDTGGSIRFPSAANSVTGLKPTWGRVSRYGVFELAATLDHIGPMARSAVDCGAMLGAIAGADPKDPTAVLDPVPDYLAKLSGSMKGMRIGVDRRWIVAARVVRVAPARRRVHREPLPFFEREPDLRCEIDSRQSQVGLLEVGAAIAQNVNEFTVR